MNDPFMSYQRCFRLPLQLMTSLSSEFLSHYILVSFLIPFESFVIQLFILDFTKVEKIYVKQKWYND